MNKDYILHVKLDDSKEKKEEPVWFVYDSLKGTWGEVNPMETYRMAVDLSNE